MKEFSIACKNTNVVLRKITGQRLLFSQHLTIHLVPPRLVILKIVSAILQCRQAATLLRTETTIAEEKEKILQEDVLFHSPFYAAAFIIRGHVNGLTEWKTSEGKTLREIEKESDQ